jgi:hypothetical protein
MRSSFDNEAREQADTLEVRRWRFEQLVKAGYAPEDASEIAGDMRVDLDFARRLVQRFGCPPELAAKILT